MSDFLLQQLDSRGVLTLTLNRPEKRNAFDDALIAELILALETAAENQAVRLVVLTSSGDHFSAGADLNWMKRMASYSHAQNLADAKELARLMDTLYHLPKPTLGLVKGAAYGGAVGLAACCDLVLAADNASFCLSEVKIGLIPAVISPYVIKAMGERQARRYFLTAEVINATQAVQLGLAHQLVALEELPHYSEQMIQQLLNNSPAALTAAKALIYAVSGQPLSTELNADTSARIADIRVSAEGQEGLNAFLEKRLPAWRQG
ncbi:enoyl-CoA hydratase/isomerase family protein [Balneatrix alpica]|uniref:Enoyl-CoA hydratase/isomerase family protein n=1 Tax=Balneatrix alpica TaxID=75684 RepID=A0ABV5Z7R3_9GAMM|nr:enoyl-CoA hydratase/isomerase family protein [Balneatrix alpica]